MSLLDMPPRRPPVAGSPDTPAASHGGAPPAERPAPSVGRATGPADAHAPSADRDPRISVSRDHAEDRTTR